MRRVLRVVRAPALSSEECTLLHGSMLFDPSALDEAIVATYERVPGWYVAVYDYDRLIAAYVRLFIRDGAGENEEELAEMASEWVSFNTIGALPSIALKERPIIVRHADETDEEDGGIELEICGVLFRQVA